ncbi:syndecan-1-like [Megalops cyprinoides]|uniref:syndecan-1-like n=1 Tax=Megalops cyprinoides TaxID=118141 RepID=UPI001864D148|nr:syndecan-1-like [Megalops cyprinoides]
MRLQVTALLLFCLGPWIHTARSVSAVFSTPYPEDQDFSGDEIDLSGSGSGSGDDVLNGSDFSEPFTISTAPPAVKTTEASPTEKREVIPAAASEASSSVSPITTAAASTEATRPVPTTPSDDEVLPEVPQHVPEETTSTNPTTADRVATPPPAEITSAPSETMPGPVETIHGLGTTQMSPATMQTSPATTQTAPATTTIPVVPVEDDDITTTENADVLLTTTPAAESDPTQEDMASGDGIIAFSTTSPLAPEAMEPTLNFVEEDIIVPGRETRVEKGISDDSDLTFDSDVKTRTAANTELHLGKSSENQSLLERKEVLGGVIAGGVVGLAFAIMLVSLMVYRMKKKDEGSYSLDEQKHSNGGYQKPQRQEEFLA